MKNFEIKTVEHKGVKVPIMLNYDTGHASLVEKQGEYNEMPYKAKQWLFKGRGLEYMDSWINILEAMTVAVKECKVLLEKDLAEKSRLHEENLVRMAGIIEEAASNKHAGHIDILKMEFKPIKRKRNANKNTSR